jgi:hypothetical protein
MHSPEIIRCRLLNQRIVASPAVGVVGPSLRESTKTVHADPAGVVAALGGVQAQDYLGALWAIGLRCAGATEVDVERAIAAGTIVRTWPMRGTLHFVHATDMRWMLRLLAPRSIDGAARRHRELGLDESVFVLSREAFVRALLGGGRSTRDELYAVLERAGVSTTGQRGYHILWRMAQEGLVCFGPRRGKQQTFVLLDEWVPPDASAEPLERDAALAALAVRYFAGHGPATVADFAWWSGLAAADARTAIALAAPRLSREPDGEIEYWTAPGTRQAGAPAGDAVVGPAGTESLAVHLLPAFDEYLVGYRERATVLDPRDAARVVPGGGGLLLPTAVADGRVVGTWKRTLKKHEVVVTVRPFAPLTEGVALGLDAAAARYGRFLGKAAAVVVGPVV